MPRPPVNTALLKEHISHFTLNKDSQTEFHKAMFVLHPVTMQYFDADVEDAENLKNNRKMSLIGAGIIRSIFNLVEVYDDDAKWEEALKNLISAHQDYSVPMHSFKLGLPALLSMMKDNAGGCTEEQTKEWTTVFDTCFKDMEGMGYTG